MSRRGAFGTDNRKDRERRKQAVNLKHGGEKVHDRRWMIVLAVIIIIVMMIYV